METYTVAKQEALKALSGAEVDLAVATLVKTGKIDRSQQTRQVVYRISVPGDDPETVVSKGPTQMITRVNPNTIDLTVRAITPPENAPEQTELAGKEFLSPNSYLQSDDELVKKHASDAVGAETDSWKAAQLMEHWIWENLKKKNFSTLLASAAEVAKDLQGDCTEHAVLLAAMCRARGIPSRVAVGLVYVPSLSSFGGHMWTEVFEKGTWIPLDATLGKGGIAADHIKFADSSFSDDDDSTPITAFLPMVSALGKMKIEVREVTHDN
jgi:transglutaminase-like putative cysteine protease